MKTFNKAISLVIVAVFVLSMMAVPALAVVADFPEATGTEKLNITYYSDATLLTPVTTVTPDSEVYAKVSAYIPTKTFRALDVDFAVENATIEGDDTKLALTGFERKIVAGTKLNTVFDTKLGANVYITLASGFGYDSPNDTQGYDTTCRTLDVDQFDINVYKLKVGSSGNVKFTATGGDGLNIGEFDFDTEGVKVAPFTIEGTLAIGGGVTTKDATFAATFDEDFEYANTLSNSELETAIKADLTVTKTVDGAPSDVDVSTLDINFNHTAKTFTVKFAKGLATGEVIKSGTDEEATFSYKVKAPAVVDYTYDHVEFNGAKVEGGRVETAYDAKYLDDETLKNAFVVYGKKTVDGVATEEVVAVPADKGHVNIGRSATSNEVSIWVYFKEELKASITLGFTDIPVVYSNIKATMSPAEFANNTPADAVKSAVEVTATTTQGVIVTNGVKMVLDTDYEVAIDGNPTNVTSGGFVTVTLIGKLAGLTLDPADGKFNFTVTPDKIEYKDFVIEFEGGNTRFLATATDEEIIGKMTVKADKYVNEVLAVEKEIISSGNFESVVIDRSTGLVTVTLKAGEPYKGETVTATITLKDVIEYRNVKATMSTRMFPAGTTDDTIKRELTIVADKYVNNVLDGAEQSTLPAEEYTVTVETVDTNNKKVKITYSEKCISVADAYKEFAVAVGISANAKITLSPAGTVNKGEDFNAAISVEGLGTNKVYAAVIKISANTGTGTGTLVSFTPAAGYDKHSEDMENGTVTVIRNAGGTAADVLGTFTIKAAADKDAEIVVKVETLKLTTVEGDDIANLPSFTGDEERIIVTEVVVPTTAKINASFDIKTLGDVTSAADKFKAGLKVTRGTDVVTVPAENIVVTEKKVELKDLEVEAGVYKVSVDVPGYTKAEVEIKVIYDSETNTMNVTSSATGREAIYAGDVDGNGSINAKDYADLVAKIGQAAAENVNCDLYTKDGEANISVNDIITMVYEFETYFGATITSAGLIVE